MKLIKLFSILLLPLSVFAYDNNFCVTSGYFPSGDPQARGTTWVKWTSASFDASASNMSKGNFKKVSNTKDSTCIDIQTSDDDKDLSVGVANWVAQQLGQDSSLPVNGSGFSTKANVDEDEYPTPGSLDFAVQGTLTLTANNGSIATCNVILARGNGLKSNDSTDSSNTDWWVFSSSYSPAGQIYCQYNGGNSNYVGITLIGKASSYNTYANEVKTSQATDVVSDNDSSAAMDKTSDAADTMSFNLQAN